MTGLKHTFKALLMVLPVGFAAVTTINAGLAIGFAANDIFFNVKKILEASYQLGWAKNAAVSYADAFEKTYDRFHNNRTEQNYRAYADAVLAFSTIVMIEYEMYQNFYTATAKEGLINALCFAWEKKREDVKKDELTIQFMRNSVRNDLRTVLDDYYYHVLVLLDFSHVELFHYTGGGFR